MAQLSRPFQIALLAAAALAGVLLFTITRSSSSTTGAQTPAVSASAPATATAITKPKSSISSSTTGSTHATHGSGDSLGGLSRAIDKAHHAGAVTQQNSNHLAEKAAQASNETKPTQPSSAATHTPAASANAAAPATSTPTKTSSSAPPRTTHHSNKTSAFAIPSGQKTVEAELAKGDIVVLLFWNPAGTDDANVHSAVQSLSGHHQVAVQVATAGQVANFGSITRGVQVYATPTVLVINKQGKTLVLTGVQDAFSIEQAIAEARSS
jgi:hypothetical protein